MATMNNVLGHLTGKEIVDTLVEMMAAKFEDFSDVQKRYNDAMRILQEELREDLCPCVKDEMEAIERQTASTLFYSGLLGIKANLDNFINPMMRSFLDVDCETYLRENTAKRLPEYESAQKVRNQFYTALSPAQREVYDDVTTYVSHLETIGPKLAHYYGYILGNEILYRVIPGYHPDMVQTTRYCTMLEKYFGKSLEWDFDTKF